MANKSRKPNTPTQSKQDVLQIDRRFLKSGELERFRDANNAEAEKLGAMLTARALASPEVRSARAIQRFEGSNLSINAVVDELREQIAEVQGGNLKRSEALLVAQAHTLDALFSDLALRSHMNTKAGYLDAADRYLRLALKAQSQCRTTLEALAEIKNPRPVAFVKQANIAHGPQQVNNGEASRARENAIPSNEQSGEAHELLPDARASQAASRINPSLEAVGKVDGATLSKGKSEERGE